MVVSVVDTTTSSTCSRHQLSSSRDVLQPQHPANNVEEESSSSSSSSPHSENNEKTSLLQALSALAKLAALETSKYETCVRRRSPKHNNNNNNNSQGLGDDGDDNEEASSTILSLDQVVVELLNDSSSSSSSSTIQSVTTTPIVDLAQSVHRLHSNITVLQSESDQQADEIQQLQQLVVTLRTRNQDLEQTIQSLHQENHKLVGKLKRKAKEKKCLVDHVKTFLRQVQDSEEQQKELEELREAYKLQAHESFLLHSNRSRTASADSNLSDGLDYLHTTAAATTVAAAVTTTSDNNLNNTTNNDYPHHLMLASDESESSVYSLVTDACPATLKLESPSGNTVSSSESHTTLDSLRSGSGSASAALLHPIPLLSSSWNTSASEASQSMNKPYTLNFPRGTKVGILIKQLELQHESVGVVVPTLAVATTPNNNNNNHYPKPNRHLTKALMESSNSEEEKDKKDSSLNEKGQPQQNHHHHFGLPFNINPFKGQQQQQQQNQQQESNNNNKQQSQAQSEEPKRAFIVSGFGDFNESLNSKPTLGARIIAINQIPIPETCTLDELMESLHASSLQDLLEDDKNDATYSVTFRDDPLTSKQREMLGIVLAEKEKEEKVDTEPSGGKTEEDCGSENHRQQNKAPASNTQESSQNKHKGFNFGFMKMGNHQDKKVSAETAAEEEDKNSSVDKNEENVETKNEKREEASTPGEDTEPTSGATKDGPGSEEDEQNKASVPSTEEPQNKHKGFNFGFMKMGNQPDKKSKEEEKKTSVNKNEDDAATKNEKRKNGNKSKVFGFWNQEKPTNKDQAQEVPSSSSPTDDGEVDDGLV